MNRPSRRWLLSVLLCVVTSSAFAANFSSTQSGSWSSASTWGGAGVPSGTDNVTINAGHTVTLAAPTTINDMTIAGGTLDQSSNTMAVSGTLNFTSGTITGSTAFNMNGASFAWSGGTISGGGAFNLSSSTTTSITGSVLNDGRAFTNNGTLSTSGSFLWRNSASFSNPSGATLNIQANVTVGWDGNGPVGSISNGGSIFKSGGTGTASLGSGSPISDSGDIEVSSGTLSITAAVTGSGSPTFYSTNAATTMSFASSGNSFPTGTLFDGLGQILIANSSTFVGSFTATSATFGLESGTQTFSTATLTGTIQYDNSTITGALTIPLTSTLNVKNSGGSHLLDAAAITNQGLVDLIAASIATRNGTSISNSGTINLEGDFSIQWDGNGGVGSITNNGTVTKVSGTGTSILGNSAPISGSGTFHAQTGTLRFSGATTSSSTTIFNADSGTTIEFTTNGNSFASGTSFNGSGAYRIASNSAFAAGSITVAGGLTLDSGTVSFNGLTVTGTTSWNNAVITGTGLTIPGGSTLNVLTAGTHLMDAGTIASSGTINCSAACIVSRNASSFTNNAGGIVNVAGDYFFGWDGNGGTGTIANDGTITKTSGTGTMTFGNGAALTGGGTYQAQSGTLQFASTITTSVTAVFNVSSGATIKFSGSGTSFVSGTVFNGSGTYDISGGSTFSSGTLTIAGSLQFNSGTTIVFNGLTVNGSTTWNNATIKGTGLTIPSGSTLTLATGATHLIDGGAITNAGTVACSGDCFHFRNGSTVTNQTTGSINIAGDLFFGWDGNGGVGSITNDGSINKTSGTGSAAIGNGAALSNTNLIRVQSGTLTISSALANSAAGILKIDDGTTMELTASGNTFASGTSFATPGTGTGLARIANSSSFTGTINCATQFRLDNGTILFSSATFNGALEWRNATITGSLTIPATSSITSSAGGTHLLDGGTIDDFATWTAAAGLGTRNNSAITIESGALLDLTIDGTFGWDGNGVVGAITNSGTIRKSAGTGTTLLGNGSTITNSSLIRAMSGTLQLNTTTANGGTGVLQADSGTNLILSGSGNTMASGSTLNDSGAIQISNSTTWNGSFTISGAGTTLLSGGTQTFNTASYIGALQWSNGTWNGTLSIPSGSSLTTNSGCCLLSNGLAITNSGTITLGQSISYRNGGGITNNGGALIDMQGDFGAAWDGNGSFPAMSINGTLRKSSGTGTSTWSCGSACGVPGAIEAKSGTINFSNGLTLSGTSSVTSTILGTTAGTGFGVVSSGGSAMTLAGTIGASVPGPFVPQGGQQFQVVTFASASGSFTNSSISFGTGRSFSVAQSASNVKLTTSGPTITSIVPSSGTEFGGTSVSINGSGFAGGGSFGVTFGGTSATCSVSSASLITCTTPAHATGTVDVTVTNADGQPTTSTNGFTFESSPFVSTFRNSSGSVAGGGGVIFEGNNLGSVTSVTFGGTNGTILYASTTSLTVAAPAHVAGTVDVVLTNASGSTTLTNAFAYVANDDLARDFSIAVNPSSRWSYGYETSRGAAFNVYGTFARTSGAFDAWNPTALPNVGRNSSASALVQATNSTPSMKVEFHPGAAGENSVVRWTAPNAGAVRISGYFVGLDFSYPTTTDVAILKNNSTASTLFVTNINSYNVPQTFSIDQTLNAGDTIEFTVGYGTNGNFNGDGTGVDATITPLTGPVVTVTSVSPASGTAGTSLTIGGTNFHAGASVTVGGNACASATVVNANTITCTAPAHASGAVDFVVTHTDSAAATLTNGFTYVSNDMGVTTGASAANVLTNSTFHYTIALSNAGSATASGMTMHAFTTNAAIASITYGGAITCTNTTSTVDCSAASFTTSDSGNVDLTMTAAASPSTSSITATVTTSNDSNAANNSSSTSVNVVSQFATITVTNNANSGANTLRQAILDANSNLCGPVCTINFALPNNARTIALGSALPTITAQVVIDGTTQSGYAGTPLVTLDGSGDTTNGVGVTLNGANSTLRGLAVVNFHNSGVAVGGANTTVSNNYIGIDPTGAAAMPNAQDGVQVANNASNTTISSNVISGNSVSGIYVTNASSTTIANNRIGVNAAGNALVSNGLAGIYTDNNATNTSITGNTIGGSPHGIRNAGAGTALHITGNFIGTNAAQTIALPNTIGVQLESFTNDNVVGGANAGEPNVIARNTSDGVIVYSTGNEIIENSIYGNGALGIHLQPGANNNQPAPVITSAAISGANLVVNYTANASAATQSLRIDFFKADASGQGKTFLFTTCAAGNNVSSSASMNASTIGVVVGDSVVALATSLGNSICTLASFADGTSPFSAAATVACTPPSAQINAPANACANATGLAANIVSPTAGSTYNWTITNGTLTSGQGTTNITYTAGATGSVQLAVSVTNGVCSSNGNATTTINSLPVVSITGPSSACPNTTVTLDAGAGFTSYSWSTGATTQTITVPSGTYSVTVTNAAGCSATVTKTVAASSAPLATITAPSSVFPNSTGNVASVTSGPAGTTYAWTITNGAITAGAGTNVITFTAGTSGSVILAVTVSSNGCTASGNAAIPIGALADLALAMSASQTAVNAGSPVSFTITVANNGPADATNVTLSDSIPATFNSASGNGWNCSQSNGIVTCTRPLLTANTSSTITINLIAPLQSTTITNSATVSSGTSDSHPANNSASASVVVIQTACGNSTPVALSPLNTTTASPVTFSWQAAAQAIGYRVWIAVDGGAAQDLGTTDGATSLKADVPPGTINWFVDALFAGCPSTRSNTLTFTVPKPDTCANHSAASLVAPANNATSSTSSIQFTWTNVVNASGYRLWASINNGDFNALGDTTNTTLTRTFSFGHITWYVETLFDGCSSIESEHRTFDITKAQNCGTAIAQLLSPDDNLTTTNASVTFSWTAVQGATSYEVWLALNNASPVLLGSTTSTTLTKDVPAGVLEWFVRANFDGCDPRDSAHRHFTFAPPAACGDEHPVLIAPLNNTTTFSPVNLSWKGVAGATSYKVLLSRDGGAFTTLTTTASAHVDNATIQNGSIDWMVEASFGNNCAPSTSATSHFVVLPQPQGCVTPGAPAIFAPSTTSSGITYTVRWQKVAGGVSYVIQESPSADFVTPTSATTNDDNADFTHTNNGNAPITFYYRVRALNNCATQPGPFSNAVGIVILPSKTLTGAIPSDQTQNITYSIPLSPSLAGFSFTATPNEPWLTVTPSSGVVPASGQALTVVANTTGLPLGTSLGGITVTTNAPSTSSRASTMVTTNTTTTVSVSLVQPVQSKSNTAPPPDALIIPAVAHADGINSKFQSDVRVTNTSPQTMKYQVTFTPTGDTGAANAKQTTLDVDPGKTVALDDILGTWFTSGTIGTLEVRPLTQLASNISNLLTFASSRTFNTTANGTFGQYIPAIPFASFVGSASNLAKQPVLSLQQIAQSDAYRTNLGLVEGSGNPASVLVSVFGGDGKKISEFSVALAAGQHTQFSLAQHNINVSDGRVEVKVTSSTGKVTAYASVLDNLTNDPMLVNPITITEGGGTKFVIPGVADLNNGFASWRTDTRVYNASASPVTANLIFYSQTGSAPITKQLTLAPNEVKQLNNTLASFFGITNDGGALHITTDQPANLITSARTYNQTTNGTYGQFINGITPNDAAGNGGRALQILQVEESDRYRSNIGIAEVNGKTATVELQVVPADGRVAAKLTFDMKPNEFRQFNSLLQGLNVGTTYNARITARVIGGEGRITAYASVIDALTNDPTFVPAQ